MIEIITAWNNTDILNPLALILCLQLLIALEADDVARGAVQVQSDGVHAFVGQHQHLVAALGLGQDFVELDVLERVLDLVGVDELVVGQVVNVHDVAAEVVLG